MILDISYRLDGKEGRVSGNYQSGEVMAMLEEIERLKKTGRVEINKIEIK